MKKVFETKLNTGLCSQSQNLFRRLWQAWIQAHGAISMSSRDSCPRPWNTLLFAAHSSLEAEIYVRVLLDRLDLPGSKIITKELPQKMGIGFVSSLLHKSAKGLTVSAKILTKLEDNEVHLSLYADSLEMLPNVRS